MARMHTKKRGKSKSRKPILDSSTFGKGAGELSKEQIENIIIDYAKQGTSPEMIGELLKRKHGVMYPRQAIGMRMKDFLKEKELLNSIPSDMLNLMKKSVNMRKHLQSNKQDVYGTIRLKRVEAKIWRLTKYYIKTGELGAKWRYDPKTAELLIRGKS